MGISTRRLAGGVLLLVSSLCAPSLAAETVPLAQYIPRVWQQQDGLSSTVIRAITQDVDGYIWVGTQTAGLYRFDGVRFVSWEEVAGGQLPSDEISALRATRDGSVWVAFGGGGSVGRLYKGQLTVHEAQEGAPAGRVEALIEDSTGAIWTAGSRGVFRLTDGLWEHLTDRHGLPDEAAFSVYEDHSGHIWIATASGIFQRPRGSLHFRAFSAVTSIRSFADDGLGTMWAQSGNLNVSDGPWTAPQELEVQRSADGLRIVAGWRLLRDRSGDIWVATLGLGVWRISRGKNSNTPVTESFTAAEGLTNNVVLSLFEDREGGVWIGTINGLNRLSVGVIQPVPSAHERQLSQRFRTVATTRDGSVWVGTESNLYQYTTRGTTCCTSRLRMAGSGIGAMVVDRWGNLVVATRGRQGRIMRLAGGTFSSLPVTSARPLTSIFGLAFDRRGTLWILDNIQGLLKWENNALTSISAVPAGLVIRSIYVDRKDRVWLAMADGVGVYDGSKFRMYSPEADLDRGHNAFPIHEDATGAIYIGTSAGVTRFSGDAIVTLTSRNGLPGRNVVAILEDDRGFLWLGLDSGVVRVHRDEFDKVVGSVAYQIQFDLYDFDDGLPGTPIWLGSSSAVRARDETLWFLTTNGMAVVNSRAPHKTRLPPPVIIEAVTVDDIPSQPAHRLQLRPGRGRLQVHYTAPTFTAPRRVRFRYLLEGFDIAWVDAGIVRHATYTNLAPGTYRFRVIADNDGAVNSSGAIWEFSIQPAFYQTRWFQLAFLSVATLSAWMIWRLRLQQIRRRFGVIVAERARMARELHDTLLQCLAGMAIKLGGVESDVVSAPAHAKKEIQSLRLEVEAYIRETRQAIWNLRSPVLDAEDLPAALRDSGNRLTAGTGVCFAFRLVGTPESYPAQIEEQLLRIGREATLNALRHAQPTSITMELRYDEGSIVLRVIDDGIGFDFDSEHNTLHGHWGAAIMEERIRQVGGHCTIHSKCGGGTTVEVSAPIDGVGESRAASLI